MIEGLLQAIPLAVVASVPLLFAVQGEIVVQRSGIINLGIEGMMLAAAMASVIAAQSSGSIALGFAGGIAGALLVAAIFGFFTIRLRSDPIVTGTAINLLALGATGFVYHELRESPLFAKAVQGGDETPVVIAAWIVAPALVARFSGRRASDSASAPVARIRRR